LRSRAAKRINRFTVDDLEINFVELSERDLQHINGGVAPRSCSCGRTTLGCTDYPHFVGSGACSCQLSQANEIPLSQANERLSLIALGEFDFIVG
jgi:hypothetical protein